MWREKAFIATKKYGKILDYYGLSIEMPVDLNTFNNVWAYHESVCVRVYMPGSVYLCMCVYFISDRNKLSHVPNSSLLPHSHPPTHHA